MALFDIPTRTNSKANDKKLAQKATTVRNATPTIKGGSSLLERISSIVDMVKRNLGKYKEQSDCITDEKALAEYIDKCIENRIVSIDTETTGLDPLQDDIAGISLFTPNMKGVYIPINHVSYITNTKVPNQLDKEVIAKEFNRFIDAKVDIIMFNAQFDMRVLRHGIGLHNIYCTWDCYIAQRLLNENENFNERGLKAVHKKYVLDGKEDAFKFDELFDGVPFTMIPISTAYIYACHDAVITYELYEYQKRFLCSDREDMKAIYWDFMNIEMPCVPVVADMEDNGILIDLEYQQELSVKYNKLLTDKLEAFYSDLKQYDDIIRDYRRKHANIKLDERINIASPSQLAILFYDILGIDVIDKKTPRGTGEEILKKIDNPLAKDILEWRTLSKLVDTYIDKLPNCINPNDGRIHCHFNQYGADTGRFSSSNPNLQNIPSHNKDIRKMFIASNETTYVFDNNNSFTVDKWSEVNTVDGWKYADKVNVGDKLLVEENNVQLEIIVSRIDTLVDKNQIVYYY